MIFLVVAYFLLQLGRHTISSLTYQFMNLIGAILLFISLCVHFNLGSFIIEIFWVVITIYGIYKNLKKQKIKVANENI